jgi:serine/threonine-protein kinase RsbW
MADDGQEAHEPPGRVKQTPVVTDTPAVDRMQPVDPDTPIDVRFLRPEEAAALTAAIERSYGRSYDASWVYDAVEIHRRLASGEMRSIVGVDGDGEIVGHLGLGRTPASAPAGHAGQAVVDPRFRGHHLFTTLKRDLATWCTDNGLLGMYSEATAAHPYSQAANLALGAHETGFLLGYIPAKVSYTEIKEDTHGIRQSVALFWLETNRAASREVHPPRWHRGIVAAIYDHNDLERRLVAPSASPALEGETRFTVTPHADHNEVTARVDRLGADALEALRRLLDEQGEAEVDVVHVELSLADPATAALPEDVHDELGVFFGGIVPELRDGDVLRLQWLNGVEARRDDVTVASDFGGELLNYVFERKGGS